MATSMLVEVLRLSLLFPTQVSPSQRKNAYEIVLGWQNLTRCGGLCDDSSDLPLTIYESRWLVRKGWGWASFVLYVGSIVAANWMIAHVGTPIPGGHVLPVGFGLTAPSGVYFAGLAFVARDLVQRTLGYRVGLVAIVVGALLSALLSTPTLALASGVTFLISESVDFAIFTPLQSRNLPLAVVISGAIGDVVDSVVFLTLAHIPLAVALEGQIVGKMSMTLLGGIVIFFLRRSKPLQASGTSFGRA